ncbi:hypothetical protein K505DRAFT_267742 [Melanomma pulvis-pyrius CBS 109.77]|uniref:MARVEL domain-containing protein n=1 Tax=Melanomma pulvis-pyrius CBS 109.77 TaxID=1314802 RepID=A0A6A6XS34_9PLEO|nr:hypothetical protein K505DRAFT_267742 [Melanomma pulvis-pyrius CBS 109.77]
MRVPQSYIQKCKVVAHVFQILLIFVAGCLTLAVLTKGGDIGGATKYYIALCFLTGPGIIYLVMVPAWRRTRRFANAYAFLALDALYTLLWFAAFIAVAMWNSNGISGGAVDAGASEKDGNCTTFRFGSESKCKLSRATVGFGVVVFIFFGVTTAISSYYMVKFRKDGVLPYESDKINPHHASGDNAAAKDNAWSTEIETHESDDEDRHTEHGGNQQEDEYALLHSTETDEGRHPGRPLSWGAGNRDSYGRNPAAPYAGLDDHANALSPGGYEEYRREPAVELDQDHSYKGAQPAAGPEQQYGSGGQGYSFSGGNR